MTATTTQALIYAAAFAYAVTLAGYRYAEVAHSQQTADIIRAAFEVERSRYDAERYNAIASVFGCDV